jgi:ribosomal protein S18 acetylase RimI-like enzyme
VLRTAPRTAADGKRQASLKGTFVAQPISDSPVRLVSAKLSDLDVIIPFVREFYSYFKYPYIKEKKRDVLKALIHNRSLGRILLIERNGKYTGYVLLAFSFSLEFNGPIAFIDELFIDPSERQKGVGSQVLKQVEALSFRLGMKAVRLESEAKNSRATALYARSGYNDHGRRLMTKQLALKEA